MEFFITCLTPNPYSAKIMENFKNINYFGIESSPKKFECFLIVIDGLF